MFQTRRGLLRHTAAGLIGVSPLAHRSSVLSQATPTPEMLGDELLLATDAAIALDPAPMFLAVMDTETHEAGHIEGDARIGWDEMTLTDGTEDGIAAWADEMRQLFSSRGVPSDQSIVCYDEGSLFAARGWWQLAYLGFPVSRVLNGGLNAWRDAGGEVVEGAPGLEGLEVPHIDASSVRPNLLATKDEILASLGDPGVFILDARSPEEYAEGHIPGAVNRPYAENARPDEGNVYLSQPELRAQYEALGMTGGKRAITYCSTGARGSVAAFSLHLAGFRDVALYAASWAEWSSDPDAPIETA